MTLLASVGKSKNHLPAVAAQEACEGALTNLAEGEAPGLAIVFATTGYDQQELLSAIRNVIGADVPMTGCSAEGVITTGAGDESSHVLAVMLFHASLGRFDTFSCGNVAEDSAAAGQVLAQAVNDRLRPDSKALLLFPDGLETNCTQLLGVLDTQLPESLQIVGGTAGDLMALEKTYQYHDGQVLSGGVSAVLLSGGLEVEIAVSHGCEPVGLERTVTKASGSVVEEIDGQPAWAAFRDYLDGDPDTLRGAQDVINLSMGERIAEDNMGGDYGEHIIHVPLRHDMETGAMFFGAEIATGTKITMTRRNPIQVSENAVSSASTLLRRRNGRDPTVMLQFDCAGRGQSLFGKRVSELGVEPIQNIFGPDLAWVGCYTFGEIAQMQKQTKMHNHTVVLCAIYAS